MSASKNQPGFIQKSNDLQNRGLSCRLFRFFRARLRATGRAAILLGDEPRIWRAWKNGWEADHYVHLLRWRDAGFSPQVVYDIGGHRGIWSEMCQSVYAPGNIILFEPQAAHHSEIQAREKVAGGRWQIMPVALGETETRSAMHLNQQSAASSLLAPQPDAPREFWGGNEVRKEEVTVTTLDSLVAAKNLPAPDLAKIDVQGYEAKVLAGGKNTLCKASRLVIEVSLRPIYEGQALLPEIVQTLTSWGFVLDDMNEALRRWPVGGLWQSDLWFTRPGAASGGAR